MTNGQKMDMRALTTPTLYHEKRFFRHFGEMRVCRVSSSECFKLPKWNVFSLKSERGLLAPPSGFIPRKVLASKLGGGLNQRSP